MTMDVEFLLTWLPCFDFGRKLRVELFNSFFVFAGSIGIALIVVPLAAVQSAFRQLLYQQSSRENITFKAHVVLLAAFIATSHIVIGIAEIYDGIVAHFSAKGKSILKESLANALTLIIGMHTEGTHCKDGLFISFLVFEQTFAVHNAAHDLSADFEYMSKLRDKVLVVTHNVDEIVLAASGNTEIPESFTVEIFYFTVVVFSFLADDIV